MLKEIKGDRQRDERIDIFSSPFGSLWEEENYFKADALMKEKGVMADVFLQRWNQQYEWLKGRWRGEKQSICLREPNGGFWRGMRVLFDSSEQNMIPLSGDVAGSTLNTVISGVCVQAKQMPSDRELICNIHPGVLIRLSTNNVFMSEYDLVTYSAKALLFFCWIGHVKEITSKQGDLHCHLPDRAVKASRKPC